MCQGLNWQTTGTCWETSLPVGNWSPRFKMRKHPMAAAILKASIGTPAWALLADAEKDGSPRVDLWAALELEGELVTVSCRRFIRVHLRVN